MLQADAETARLSKPLGGSVMSHEILVTIAQVAVTLAGFSGVIFALGNRAGRSLSAKEESGLTHMLLTSQRVFGVGPT